MVVVCDGIFCVSGNDYEEVGPHDDWGFDLYRVRVSGDEFFSHTKVKMPYALREGRKYYFDVVKHRAGGPVSLLLVERD